MTLTDREFRIMEEAHRLFADGEKVGAYKKRANVSVKDICDQHHSFNELYEHRRKLSAIIFNQFKKYAWKSRLHDDGEMWENLFIVGVTIPNVGDYSYHYHPKYWDEFDVPVVDRAPVYDGHTPKDIDRLFELAKLSFHLPINHPNIEHSLDSGSLKVVTANREWFVSMVNGDKEKRDMWEKVSKHRMSSGYPYFIFTDSM